MARFYDSRVASFCSADPVEGNPENPQSWNRYAYVQNDPVNLTDPSGRFLGLLIALFNWLLNFLAGIGVGIGQAFGSLGQLFITQIGSESQLLIDPATGAITSAGGGAYYGLTWAGAAAVGGGLAGGVAAAGAAGGGQAPLSSNDMSRFEKAQDKANHDLNNKDCQKFLQQHDVDPNDLKDAVQKEVPFNGVKSTISVYDSQTYDPLEGVNSTPRAITSFQQETVAQSFANNNSIYSTQWATSQVGGHSVYFRPGGFLSSGGITAANVIHEALHNLLAKGDTRLAAQLGLPNNAGSADINPILHAHHCF
jgi:hypothetical protein